MQNRYEMCSELLTSLEDRPYPLSVNQRIAITEDHRGIARVLAEKLKSKRFRVDVCIEDVPVDADVVILLEGLSHYSSVDAAIESNRTVFLNGQRIAKRFSLKGGLLIVVQDIGGQFGMSTVDNPLAVWAAGVSGFVKTAQLEWPKATCRILDLQCSQLTPAQIAEKLYAEVLHYRDYIELGISSIGHYYTLVPRLTAGDSQTKLTLPQHPVIIVSGGARGITAACLLAWAAKLKARFVLLGRTVLDPALDAYSEQTTVDALQEKLIAESKQRNEMLTVKQLKQKVDNILAAREVMQTCAALTAAGSEAVYYTVDITKEQELRSLLDTVRAKWGDIHGLVHAAGVLADKLIVQQSLDQFDRVFATKVVGLKNLLALTKQDPLHLLCLFSSVAARFGNVGQVAYAMANEVLNKVAQFEQQQRGKHCLVKSFNWGPWDMGMVTPELKRAFQQRGIALLDTTQGCELFVNELKMATGVEVVCGSSLSTKEFSAHLSGSMLQTVHESTHPFLWDHQINKKVILPMCVVLDWFLRIAQYFPTYTVVSCEQFKCLRGIHLTNANLKHEFEVRYAPLLEEKEKLNLSLKLSDNTQVVYYSAQLLLQLKTEEQPIPTVHEFAKFDSTQTWPFLLADIYTKVASPSILFHGPLFHAIVSLDKVDAAGGSATLRGLRKLRWPEQPWAVDVALIDGILQVLIVWGFYRFRQKTLPTSIGRYVAYTAQLPPGELRCIVDCQMREHHGIVANARIVQENGELYAELRDIEMFVVRIKDE